MSHTRRSWSNGVSGDVGSCHELSPLRSNEVKASRVVISDYCPEMAGDVLLINC